MRQMLVRSDRKVDLDRTQILYGLGGISVYFDARAPIFRLQWLPVPSRVCQVRQQLKTFISSNQHASDSFLKDAASIMCSQFDRYINNHSIVETLYRLISKCMSMKPPTKG
jgi:hypothetical protein